MVGGVRSGSDDYFASRFLRYYRNPPYSPDIDELLSVQKTEDGKYHGYAWEVKYLPGGTIWAPDPHYIGFVSKDRANRVTIRLYKDEVVDFDAIDPDLIHRYINDRSKRKDYASSFSVMGRFAKLKKKEEQIEEPLAMLVLNNLGLDVHDEELRVKCREVIRWWKLKTKVRRAVTEDDAKAVRMVQKELKKRLEYDVSV